jgi:acyl-CoA synthetase (AMP-forming)/AMP-acid ligase II
MNIPLTPVRFLNRATAVFARNTAVVCESFRLSYAELGERVERLANALLGLGIQPGDRVSFLGYNCHRLLECYYGVLKIGAVLMPLNIRLATSDFEYIFNDAHPVVVFVHPDFTDKLEPFISQHKYVKRSYLLEDVNETPNWTQGTYDELLTNSTPVQPHTSLNYPFSEDDPAEIFYTSGTTGPPKGVQLTHRNLYLHALAAMASMPIWETDVQLHLIALFHVNGWGTPQYLTAKGGTHVIQKIFDPEDVLRLVQDEKVTRFYIVPTMVSAILELPNLADYDLSSMREILIGGAPPPSGMCVKAEEVFGCTVHGGFGMSETCPLIALPELPPDMDVETLKYRAHETWGFPTIGTEYKLIDSEGREQPWDGKAVGELLVRGDQVMKGYLNKSAETDAVMEGGWYHTGDLASMGPNGSLYICDRIKDIIISGGENISSLEIEKVIYSLPDVLECAVIGKSDPKWGEIPKAIVILRPGTNLTADDIVEFSREQLSHFKALREVQLVESMPRSGTGKILKKKLRKMYG